MKKYLEYGHFKNKLPLTLKDGAFKIILAAG
jgi:hypothetical protein